MALLPFYIPGTRRIKVVIVGGGYAGMTVLTTLKRYASDVDIILIDPRDRHLKITHLHETFRYPLSDLEVPFDTLATRFNCRHIQATLVVTEELLQQWQESKSLSINDEIIDFDYLVITTGVAFQQHEPAENVLTQYHFTQTAGSGLLSEHLSKYDGSDERIISVIGAGATGIQFLFEIKQFLNRQKIKAKLRLIHSGNRVLMQFPQGFDTYVQSRMRELSIDFVPNYSFSQQINHHVQLKDMRSGQAEELPSHLTLLFIGKRQKQIWSVNMFGQIVINRKTLQHIFAAGDCSSYSAFGSNIQSAQSAVRKGKLVGRNILRHSGLFTILEPYLHHDIGYVVNLGFSDAVGWLISEGRIVTGLPALTIKELVEAQYDLLLKGIDTYVV